MGRRHAGVSVVVLLPRLEVVKLWNRRVVAGRPCCGGVEDPLCRIRRLKGTNGVWVVGLLFLSDAMRCVHSLGV